MDLVTLINNYEDWWSRNSSAFEKQTVKVDGEMRPLIQREYAPKYANEKLKKHNCKDINIPLIEITPYYKEAEDGLLFVNCNPSGTDYKYYVGHNNTPPNDFYIYDNQDNSYFNKTREFANKAEADKFAMIDVFPLVIQNQAVLKTAISEAYSDQKPEPRWTAFYEMMELFIKNVVEIKPKVIVATNAFVKDLFTCDDEDHPYSFPNQGLLNYIYQGDDLVYYKIAIPRQGHDDFEAFLFCGGMIAGGHQMDTQSKARLIRDVKHFLSGDSIQLWPPKL